MTMWTVTQDDRLRELWATGATCAAIGAEIGFTGQGVSQRAQALDLPTRRYRRSPMWEDGDLRYLAKEAEKRGISIYVLRSKIIQIVLRDRMIDAVLDDQKEPWPESAAKSLSDYQKANGRSAT
jgi:hypothetical protein